MPPQRPAVVADRLAAEAQLARARPLQPEDRTRERRLPQPDSPTSASTSPLRTSRLTPSTARATAPPAGNCIVVVATDAPLGSAQLERLARRAGLGLARTGSVAHHGSGEIFLAFAAGAHSGGGPPARGLPDTELDALFACAVEATEEAVLNALWFARDTDGREGRLVRALPHADVLDVLAAHGRLER